MSDQQHFKYQSAVHLGPVEPEPPKIIKIKNLIPIEIEYEDNGQREFVTGFIDYGAQEVRVPDKDDPSFAKAVVAFLMHQSANPNVTRVEIPEDVMKEFEYQQQRQVYKPQEEAEEDV